MLIELFPDQVKTALEALEIARAWHVTEKRFASLIIYIKKYPKDAHIGVSI